MRILIESTGLLSSPVASGPALAFIEWDVNRMPWDSSRLCLATLDGSGQVEQVVTVASGPEGSVAEPQWGPDGELYFLSDRTGWWNLHRWHEDDMQHVLAVDQDCGPAPWEAGYRSYTFLPDGTIIFTLHDGCSTWLASTSSDSTSQRLETGLTSAKSYVAAFGDRLAVIGSTPSSAPAVRLVDLVHGEPAATLLDSGRSSDRADHAVSIVSERETASVGATVRFLLRLPPTINGAALPLLVCAHPGPTDEVPLRLDWSAEFFTSRGFAVADVAYRGSSGQGRAYRQVLYGHWGEFDVQDCAAAAEHLLAEGVARPGAVFISGASAGGYTALKAACHPGPFTVATAISAIIDPHRWQTTAPRFQRPYAALLAGPAGPVRTQQVTIPVLLIHGTNDAVAPVDDARQLAAELRKRGKEHESLFLEGAGYLSEPQSQEAALSAEAPNTALVPPDSVLELIDISLTMLNELRIHVITQYAEDAASPYPDQP